MFKIKKLNEECGIFGGYCLSGNIAPYLKCGLLKLQHRGQESAGISFGGEFQKVIKNYGLVNSAIGNSFLKNAQGNFGIGHVRYSTFGDDRKENIRYETLSDLG